MNIYRISQTTHTGYDTYDSAVVIAESEENARWMHPEDGSCITEDITAGEDSYNWYWTHPDNVIVELIGKASEQLNAPIVICASFNAG